MNSYSRKNVAYDNTAANMGQYIAADYIMLHNVVQFYRMMLHNFAYGGEKVWLGRE